jgi:hypothetical protein
MNRCLLCASILLFLCGCGDQPDTTALNMPAPTPVEEALPEDEPIVAPKQRKSMNAAKVGNIILQAVQIGNLSPDGEGAFEIRLFDSTSWPARPQAWVGGPEPNKGSMRYGTELPGNAYELTLPLPSSINSDSRLWIRMKSSADEYVRGAFKLQH